MSEIDHGAMVARLRRYVGVDTTNPGAQEAALASLIAAELNALGAEVHVVDTFPGRPSIAAVWDSRAPGPRLVLNGHMDTVPVGPLADWSCDPFGGDVRDGLMFGRGACDMKAGLAVQVAVAEALRSQLVRGSLVLHFAVGEERAEPGTSSLLAAGFGGDLGVVTEPTSLAVAVAQRGAAFVRVTLTGHGGHGGRPQLAVNPISWIPAVLAEIQAYLDAIELEAHPLLGSPTCTPTVVRAGETQNVIPDECQLIFDRRLLPGESPGAETEAIERRLSTAFSDRDLAVSVELVGEGFEPCEINSDSLVASVLLDAAAKVRGHRQAVIGTPFASDVRNLVLQGAMDAVTFGPGSIDQAHRADEYVPLDEVSMAAEILLLACRALLG